ncbi:MAG: hypothetical protein QOJ56_802, partial [Mycobacterium sp.]|nr:hypothetical protein [Mycobacterium sp.]
SQSTQSAELVIVGAIACLIGSVWMLGAVILGLKTAVLEPLSTQTASQLH